MSAGAPRFGLSAIRHGLAAAMLWCLLSTPSVWAEAVWAQEQDASTSAFDRGRVDERPNILLVLAEDMSARVGAFGDDVAVTPHLDALAAAGVRYDHVFTTSGVCAPSRAALMMGIHQNAFGAGHMRSHGFSKAEYLAVPPPNAKAFPELLRRAGYYTYVTTKLDYQFSGIRPGEGPFTIWDAEAGSGNPTLWRERPADTPFFGMVTYMETHESGIFPRCCWPRNLTHLVMAGLHIYLHWGSEDVVLPGDVALPSYYPDTPEIRGDIARHYNNIRTMDQRFGELMAELEADGLAENTIVVWSTDHGDGLPRAKRELFDSGVRVPMIIRWPEKFRPNDANPGSLDHRLVSFVDLGPQILAWAGVATPDSMQGRAVLDGPKRAFIFAARDRMDAFPDRQRAVRDARFKYIRNGLPGLRGAQPLEFRENQEGMRSFWAALESGHMTPAQKRWFEPRPAEELYDLASDPEEVENLAPIAAHRDTLERMRKALEDWQAGFLDLGQIPEIELAESMWPGGTMPVTATPRLSRVGDKVEISVSTAGASIGYRVEDRPWQLYDEPIMLASDQTIEAKAVRYGWQESESARLER